MLTASSVIVCSADRARCCADTSDADAQLATIKQDCVACHNDGAKTGGVSFEGMTAQSIGQHADVFEKAVRKLRGRVMPPPGFSRQLLSASTADALVAWLETSLDKAAGHGARAGTRSCCTGSIARSTRMRFAISSPSTSMPSSVLPADDVVDGFDNIAAGLQVSPSFIEPNVMRRAASP